MAVIVYLILPNIYGLHIADSLAPESERGIYWGQMLSLGHRHLSNIDCLMPALFTSFVL